jgi:hypothetical protein
MFILDPVRIGYWVMATWYWLPIMAFFGCLFGGPLGIPSEAEYAKRGDEGEA